ncbi:MAG: Iojap-related protein [Polaromonas sp.]|jgi:ribosome-associated protein|nr:Iojap-related protein [Polaromonas sp.]
MTTTPGKTSSSLDKKDVQKLQRAIIDGLEDVKAQDIQVFDTEHITSLFERVIVASGTSNRQTKALAASVRDAVRDAGFSKPRIEGEENGEWIIVDCGAAVAHIMQPTIRQYYHLEELWGEKPVKLKLGAPAPVAKAAAKSETKSEPKAAAKAAVKTRLGAAKPLRKKAAAPKPPVRDHEPGYIGKLGKTSDWTARRNETAPVEEPPAKPARATRAAAGAKTVAKKAAARTASTAPLVKVGEPKKSPTRTAAAKKAPAKKAAAKKVAVKAAAKTTAKKPTARKTASRSE